MGKPKTKKWNNITEITEKWVKDSYPNASAVDSWKYKDRVNSFFVFMGLTDKEFIESFKRATDRTEWSKQMGLKVVAYYNERVRKGYATNSVRAEVSTVRAFCRDNCTTLVLPRRKIAKAKIAKGEHEFVLGELQRMFHVADVRDKAILATAVSLGFSVEDFANLPRDLIESLVTKAISEKIDFIGFDYERAKTGVQSRSHLTPEARDSLKAWFEYIDIKRQKEGKPKSEWVWCNGNSGHLTDQALNDVIKNLVQKANITTTGKIRFHLLRKFLMNALHDADFGDWEVKRALGKEIPTSDSTYLQGLSRKLSEKFPTVYDHIRLTGYMNHNHLRIEELAAQIQQQQFTIEQLTQQNLALQQIVEFAIPIEQRVKAVMETVKTLPNMDAETLSRIERELKRGNIENATAMIKAKTELDDKGKRGLQNIMDYVKAKNQTE